MKRTLVVATTVFHVLVAIQMKRTILKSSKVDLILGDETPNMERIVERIKGIKIFEDVYFVKMNDYNKSTGKYSNYSPANYAIRKYIDVYRMFHIRKKYDIYLVPFYHHFHMNLYSFMKRFVNPKIRVYLYEEGVAIYSGMGKIYDKLCKEYKDGVYKKFHYGRMLYDIKGILTFNPQLLQWGMRIKKIKIPLLKKKDDELKRIYNRVFNYDDGFGGEYNNRVIYFEEAKNQDGLRNNDIKVINDIAEIIGKENILIKLHPRSEKNRFERIGYKTNSDTLLPWEVVYMNHDFSETIFVSTASSSIVYPVILFGEKTRAMFLFKMVNEVIPVELQDTERFIENVIVANYKDYFYIPSDIKKVAQILSEI